MPRELADDLGTDRAEVIEGTTARLTYEFTAGIDWRQVPVGGIADGGGTRWLAARLILLLTGAVGGCGYPVHFGYKAALEAGTAGPQGPPARPDYGGFEPWLPALLGVKSAHAAAPAVSASSVIHLPDLPNRRRPAISWA